MRLALTALFCVWLSACSGSGGVAGSGNTGAEPDPSLAMNVDTSNDSAESSDSDSESLSLDQRSNCDGGEATLRARPVGPVLFDEGGVSVLEVRVGDKLMCEPVFAASGDYDNGTRVFTSDPMEVGIPPGEYVVEVTQYACWPEIVCEVASPEELNTALAKLDRGPACKIVVSIETGQELDLVVDYSSAVCEISVGDIDGGIDGPVIYADHATEGEEALATGTVDLVDGCLILSEGSGNETGGSVLVWRAGTAWNANQSVVVLPDGRNIAMGDGISAGGGFHSRGQIGTFVTDEAAQARIAECAASDGSVEVFVIQHPVEVLP